MVRWRFVPVLALLLLIPSRTYSNSDEDEMDPEREFRNGYENSNNGVAEVEDDDSSANKEEIVGSEIVTSETMTSESLNSESVTSPQSEIIPTTKNFSSASNTSTKRPLECFVCTYKAESSLRDCLDPNKNRAHVITCLTADEKCYTTVVQNGSYLYKTIERGCLLECPGSPETTCCEVNRCNSRAFPLPVIQRHQLKYSDGNKSDKSLPSTVMFFVTILLTLQTVVKVTLI